MQANMGVVGEFRCVVKRADGSTKIDTGYQKNLILNQGLDFFGGDNGSDMMAYCVIGSGNSQPSYTQNKLDTAITGVSGATFSTKYDYNAATDGNLYKTNRVCKYSFTGLNNVNISELGLASTYSNATTYFLCTRALIKDSQGNPTTITVLSGEILEIYYKLWAVYDTTDKTGQLNVLDGAGGSTAYNYTVRPSGVGLSSVSGSGNFYVGIGAVCGWGSGNTDTILGKAELSTITSTPTVSANYTGRKGVVEAPYASGSNNRKFTLNFDVSSGNGENNILFAPTTMGIYQISIKKASDATPFTKTNTQTLSLPIEFSWGRYEGTL